MFDRKLLKRLYQNPGGSSGPRHIYIYTRPNHMSNQIDNPKAPALANLRRAPGGFHSVAKQAPFRVAFRVDFGGQGGSKACFAMLCNLPGNRPKLASLRVLGLPIGLLI